MAAWVLLWGCSEDSGDVAAGGAGGTAATGAAGAGGSNTGGAPGGSAGAGGGLGGGGGVATGGTGAVGPPTLARIGETVDVPTLAASAPKRFVDIAHDDASDVYLVITGSSAISATFVSGDGQALGSPLSLAETTAWAQGPRVAVGGGKFLVAWHDNRQDPNQPELHGRIVSWSGSAAQLSPSDFLIAPPPTRAEAPPGIAWSETSKLFLVVWQYVPSTDLRARRVDAGGVAVGPEIALTGDPDWQSDPCVAWNPTSDEFLVVWAQAAGTASIRARRISAADGSLLGSEVDLGAGTHIPAVVYQPAENGYLAAWWGGATGATARALTSSGDPDGAPFDPAPGYGSYDGLAIARHPDLGTTAIVLHGSTDENFAAAFDATGQHSAVIQATESPDSIGNFNPRVAANPLKNEWMMVTSRAFTTVAVQRLGP